jgi:uncharacterized membrane protein YjjB (DUF3815 family)
MNLVALVTVAGLAGLFAGAMSIIFAAPSRAVLPSFCAGFVARLSRDALVAAGADVILATLVAAVLVGLIGEALVRRRIGSPVVVVSALVPLGAALPLFRVIVDFLRISSLPAAKLALLPQAMLSDLGRVFTTTAAIGLGVFMAAYAGRFMRRESLQD